MDNNSVFLKFEDKKFNPTIYPNNSIGTLLVMKFYVVLFLFSYIIYSAVSFLHLNIEKLEIYEIAILGSIIIIGMYPILVENIGICFKYLFLLVYKEKIKTIKYIKYINKIPTKILIDKMNTIELTEKNKEIIKMNLIVRCIEKQLSKEKFNQIKQL